MRYSSLVSRVHDMVKIICNTVNLERILDELQISNVNFGVDFLFATF